jgi:histidine triad (HIT) family protein
MNHRNMESKEQILKLKNQVMAQIDSTFPEEKKQQAIDQINSMNDEQFLVFLKQNNLIKDQDNEDSEESENKTPFRLIVEEKIPSYKIDENKEAIAVLEINPISKAHILIIPKSPVIESNKLPKTAFSLAKKISKKITTKFKPKEVLITSANVLGETIINIIPKYSNENINSERKPSSKEDLEELHHELEVKKKTKVMKEPKIKKIENKELWLPKRIP